MKTEQTETFVLAGWLEEGEWGEASTLLLQSEDGRRPVADLILNELAGKQVSLRYWLAERCITRDEAIRALAALSVGLASGEFEAVYSDITGFLWLNEELKIGGHDLLTELYSGASKYLLLEADIEKTAE